MDPRRDSDGTYSATDESDNVNTATSLALSALGRPMRLESDPPRCRYPVPGLQGLSAVTFASVRAGSALVVSALALVISGCGSSHPPAPRSSALPLAPGLSILSSMTGPSVVDSASGEHFRYMIIAGRGHGSSAALLRAEARELLDKGWRLRATTLRQPDGHTETFGLAAHGVEHGFFSPNGVYAALAYIADQRDLKEALGPSGQASDARLRRNVTARVPLLSATLSEVHD